LFSGVNKFLHPRATQVTVDRVAIFYTATVKAQKALTLAVYKMAKSVASKITADLGL